MACRYTLFLRYSDQKFYLAPRYSISIDEGSDFEAIDDADSDCATCDAADADRTWKLQAHFTSCDLTGAWAMYNALNTFLAAACDEDLIIERRVCLETALVYKVKKVKAVMGDTLPQRMGRPRDLIMDLAFELTHWDPEGAVVLG